MLFFVSLSARAKYLMSQSLGWHIAKMVQHYSSRILFWCCWILRIFFSIHLMFLKRKAGQISTSQLFLFVAYPNTRLHLKKTWMFRRPALSRDLRGPSGCELWKSSDDRIELWCFLGCTWWSVVRSRRFQHLGVVRPWGTESQQEIQKKSHDTNGWGWVGWNWNHLSQNVAKCPRCVLFFLNKRSSRMTKNYNPAKKGPTKQCPGLGSGVQVCYCDENCLNSVYWFKATNADGDHVVLKDREGDIGQLLEHIFSFLKHIPENICVLSCFMLCLNKEVNQRKVRLMVMQVGDPDLPPASNVVDLAGFQLCWKSIYASWGQDPGANSWNCFFLQWQSDMYMCI